MVVSHVPVYILITRIQTENNLLFIRLEIENDYEIALW